MGLLDVFAAQANNAQDEGQLTAIPRTLGERLSITAGAIFAPDRYFMKADARDDRWQAIADQLHTATGQTYLNPYASVTAEEALSPDFSAEGVIKARQQKIIDARTALQQSGQGQDIPDPTLIDQEIAAEGVARREKEARASGTGNGIGNFIGGMAMSTVEPLNMLSLLVPVSRLPTTAAAMAGETFLRNVGREALLQGTANAGLTAVTEAADYATRKPLGTAPELGEMAADVAASGAFGAILGGGLRALHLKWLGLPEKVREKAPLEVRDAFQTIETDALYSGKNRLGLDPNLHERYQGNAMDAILRGRPMALDELSQADTALTALGTILREAPERIDVGGLRTALERTTALPDSELEPIARELKPQSFKALDAIDEKLRALDERVQGIHQEAAQIGLPDVTDLDTAARLQDIEDRLAGKGLRKAVREELERERTMITESLGPEMQNELAKMRAEFFPEHGSALKQIADERAGLLKERAIAAREAGNEVDFLRSKLDKIKTGEPQPKAVAESVGLNTPADFGLALQRAEMMRQARVVRENVRPEPPAPEPVQSRPSQPNPAKPTGPSGEGGKINTAPEIDMKALLKGKEWADVRKALAKELEGHEIDVKDAQAIVACASSGAAL